MKLAIGAGVVLGGAVIGLFTVTNMRVVARLDEFDARLAQIEKRSAAATPEAGKVAVATRPAEAAPVAPGALDDLSKQLAALRTELDTLKKAGVAQTAALGGADGSGAVPATTGGLAGQNAEVAAVVAQVLAQREADRDKERQQRMDEMSKERMTQVMERLTTELALTEQQKAAIAPILSDTQKKIQEMFQNRRGGDTAAAGDAAAAQPAPEGGRSGMREEMGKVMLEADNQVKAQLTAEQVAKYEVYRQTTNPLMGGGMGGGRGGFGGFGGGGGGRNGRNGGGGGN